jgi:hypothetical protein
LILVVDSREPIYTGGKDALGLVYTVELKDQYPEAHEEVDTNAPSPLVDEMEITVFVDSDHAHDQSNQEIDHRYNYLRRTNPCVLFQQAKGLSFYLDLLRRILRDENCSRGTYVDLAPLKYVHVSKSAKIPPRMGFATCYCTMFRSESDMRA